MFKVCSTCEYKDEAEQQHCQECAKVPPSLSPIADHLDLSYPHGNFLKRARNEKEWSSWTSVRLACIHELGFALMYMGFLHSDFDWEPQKSRVHKLAAECATRDNADLDYWRHFFARIIDEIENMC